MILDLLRHGEPLGGQRYRGHGCDDPLNQRGWQQMRHSMNLELPVPYKSGDPFTGQLRSGRPACGRRVWDALEPSLVARRPPSMAPDGPFTRLPQRAAQCRADADGGVQKPTLVHDIGRRMDQGPYDQVWTSPLKRCQDFAQHYAQNHALPITILPDWREIGFGAWEGLTERQVRTLRPAEYTAFREDPVHCRPPGAESISVFRERVEQTLLQIWQPGHTILAVVHTGVVRAILGWILDMPDHSLGQIRVAFASLSRVQYTQERGWQVVFTGLQK